MEYHLKSIGKTCAGSGAPLPPGSTCYSVLVHRAGELARLDFSADAWQGPPAGTTACWKTTVPSADSAAKQPLDADALMRAFEQLSEEGDPAQERFRYVLAVLLLKKRRLELVGTRLDDLDDEYLQLAGARGEGAFEVRNERLEGEDFDQAQNEIGLRLSAGWSE